MCYMGKQEHNTLGVGIMQQEPLNGCLICTEYWVINNES